MQMHLYHVAVEELRKGFLEIRAVNEETAQMIASQVLAGEKNPGIHWTEEDIEVTGISEHPEEWTNDNF